MRTDYNNSKKTGGIYAAIIVCLAAVLILTYFSARSIFNKVPDDDWSAAADSAASDLQKDNASDDTMLPTVKPESKIIAGSSSKDASSKQKETNGAVKKTVKYNLPLKGEVVLTFSNDTPVFSKTMEDWRIHTGVDLSGKLGDSVKAAAAGTVEDVYTDELKGVTVVIMHADNVRTLYCGLDKTVPVEKGAIVKEGDVIGKIGDTNELESLDSPHLHFEMLKNGVYLDPVQMMK